MRYRLRTLLVGLALVSACFAAWVGLAVVVETLVSVIHLAMLYGIEPAFSGEIYVTSTKPALLASNGDRLPGCHDAIRFVVIAGTWVPLCVAIGMGLGKLAKRLLPQQWRRP
jgi:hypothetical protein